MTRREIIIAKVKDLASDFAYYDRKKDDELPLGDLNEALSEGDITINEIVKIFEAELIEELI